MMDLSMLGILSQAHIWLYAKIIGEQKVGEDMFGNQYYVGTRKAGRTRQRRWVVYAGEPEASKVPPEWHAWLHHTSDAIPQNENPLRRPWQKPHQQNLTGTQQAYLPPGHMLEGGEREKATGDYEAWTPPQ